MVALLVTIAATTAPPAAPWHPETHRILAKAAVFRAKGQISAESALLEGLRLGRTRGQVDDGGLHRPGLAFSHQSNPCFGVGS